MPSLMKVLFLIFWPQFFLAAFFKLIQDSMSFVQPTILRLMISFVEGNSPSWEGYMYALIMFAAAAFQSILLHAYFHIVISAGIKIKTALTGLIYSKALRLNSVSRNKSTAGDMVNLMSVDAQRVLDMCTYINLLWSGPLQIVVALYFLYDTMGWSIVAGVVVMVLLIPFNLVVTRFSRKLQLKQMANKDSRIRIMNEILNGMKVLKLYAWEESFMAKVTGIRNQELHHLKNAMYLNAFFGFTFTCAPFLVSLATFAIYVLTGNILTANNAFVAISLFNILRFPLTVLPNVIISYVQAQVSLKRLTKFLTLDELDETNVHKKMPSHISNQAIHVDDGSFSWDVTGQPTLHNINLNIPDGSLVAVVGQVGCGKSTLLSALLGETEKVTGEVYVKGSVAYVPQQAWIQNATLRDNVIFGRNFDSRRYHKTIKVCALETDFDILPAGDMTEIGERGINLSGGQKQRVNLARAVYFNADVYLLDDPLSAVDSHVGKHIFDKVIGPRGKLRKKTRVLVTHGISFLPQVDQIVVLQDGRVSEVGTYKELLANRGAFAEFLKTFAPEEKSGDAALKVLREVPEDEEDILVRLQAIGDEDEMFMEPEPQPIRRRGRANSVVTIGTTITSDTADTDCMTIMEEDREVDHMIGEEKAATGSVKWVVFWAYAKSIGVFIASIVILFMILSEGALVGSRIWLAAWSADNDTSDATRDMYLGGYAAFGFFQAFFVLVSSICLAFGSVRASRSIHDSLLIAIFHAPMSFFETTPLGRVVNRFSKDLYVVDDTVPRSTSGFLRTALSAIGTLFAITYATPLFLSVIIPLGIVYVLIQRLYVASSRQLKRIESVSKSPIYNNFFETISGTSTIRAYHQQQRFIRGNYYKVDENQLAYYPLVVSNRWLGLRLEFVGNLIIFFAALFAVVGRDSIESALVGMSITYALQITQTLNMMVRQTSELETNIVSVERTKEYADMETEAEWVVEDSRPPKGWPDKGRIQIEDFDLRYRANLPLVLKNISVDIQPGEKIGIVGRTGAGKSTLTLALFRILESAGGRIVVDDLDISKMGLQDLRSSLTIIPQDPVLFSGTLRFNLDPFDAYSDEDLWEVLEVSHLKAFASGLPEGLLHPIAEGGENLSVGQRQLVCLARALLRKSKVLVLDEATAAVDLETDELIQNTIRTEFAERTVFTIAHRLNTIMDYSRILVLDKGFMMEFDSPQNLIAQRGIFYGMAQDAGLA
ncbi:predicted protein [Nematostella vectensis]|uniref:ABC-type glutathione-S-conjugate transporter n=1 Tax=Nematostella vectensis TaxID=45351 RepID=A7SII0_NEMVE|nr:predicted protein [Nematostella vectensis]|eukprot:XP_001628537.1 predicted protein [Nematostella vectensis]